MDPMSEWWKVLFYGVAVACFVVAAFAAARGRPKVNPVALVAAGLAFATFPVFWDTLAVATA